MINIKIGTKARDIMEENFPVLDSSLTLKECIKKLKSSRYEACLVLNNGIIHSVLDYEDLVREYIKGKGDSSLKNIETRKNFAIIKPDVDVREIIYMMKDDIEYFIVKDNLFIGIITKDTIVKNNHLFLREAMAKIGI